VGFLAGLVFRVRVLLLVFEEEGLVGEVAAAVGDGVQAAGENPVRVVCENGVLRVKPSEFDLVFLGFEAKGFLKQAAGENVFKAVWENVWKNVKIGVFSVCSSDAGRLAASDVADALAAQGARVLNVLSLKGKKSIFSKTRLSETDLARARGFGERTTNNAKQVVVRKESEKHKISGYGRK